MTLRPRREPMTSAADRATWNLHVFATLNAGCSRTIFYGRLFASISAKRMRSAMLRTVVNSVAFALFTAAGLTGQTPPPATSLSETDKVVAGLRQVSNELNSSMRSFYTHLDQTIERLDRGYRTENGRSVQGADVDLIGGPPEVTWGAIRKFVAFRMMAARRPEYAPELAADLERIQQLILETRKRVDASSATLRRLLVVSVADFDPQNDAAMKTRHFQLLKARVGAEEAAKRAMLALPLDQPDAGAPEEAAEKAWDLLGRGLPAPKEPIPDARQQTTPPLPLRIERRKRVTLISEASYRMAVTDSGIEDEQGRHIFYQEEWVQRGQSVIRYRWRVSVETATGEHILLKRYPARELRGDLDVLYGHRDRDYVWYLEPPDESIEPTRNEVESALAEVARSREAVRAATRDFKTRIRETLAHQDRLSDTVNEPVVDSGLPDGMRQTLFAIRAHLARVPAVVEAEGNVRHAISQAETAVRDLEPLAAWSNRTDRTPVPEAPSPSDWAQLLDRSDWEIDSVRNAETEALGALPPDSSRAEDRFPALDKNFIIRIRKKLSANPEDRSVHCLQEVWRMGGALMGDREVKRTVSLILVDPETGNQTRVGGGTRYYKASAGDGLEEIFDEYASDEVSLGS